MNNLIFEDEWCTFTILNLTELRVDGKNAGINPVLPGNFPGELFFSGVPQIELPEFPDPLTILHVYLVKLIRFPEIPVSLVELRCASCCLSELPEILPPALRILMCGNNPGLRKIPALPETLTTLSCVKCGLARLPALPGGLTYLECSYNMLAELPALPGSLRILRAGDNKLRFIPEIPGSLTNLVCPNNFIRRFPAFPPALERLVAYCNKLEEFPAPCTNLVTVNLNDNRLTELPDPWSRLKLVHATIRLVHYTYKITQVPEYSRLRNHYLVILKLIRFLESALKIPVDLVRLLFQKFLVQDDLWRIT